LLDSSAEITGSLVVPLDKLKDLASTLSMLGSLQAAQIHILELQGHTAIVCDIAANPTYTKTLEAILQSSLAIEVDIKKIVELSGNPGLFLSIDTTPCTLYLLDSSAEITGSLVASLDKIQLISSLLQMSGVLSASIIKVRYVMPDLAGGVVYIIGIDGTITVAPIYGAGKATVK
jgi:hypothetical protein